MQFSYEEIPPHRFANIKVQAEIKKKSVITKLRSKVKKDN